jgi:hypothetical protein
MPYCRSMGYHLAGKVPQIAVDSPAKDRPNGPLRGARMPGLAPRPNSGRRHTGPVHGAGRPPRTVRWAVWLMLAGAALEVAAALVALNTESSLWPASAAPNARPSAADLQGIASHVQVDVTNSLVAAALWLWMAWANRRGQNAARIISAVFFAFGTKAMLNSFGDLTSAATRVVDVVIWLAGLAAIVLVFYKESEPFYRSQPA